MRPVVLLACLLISVSLTQAQADCPSAADLAPRLAPGIRAQVESGPGSANRVRAAPGLEAEISGQLAPGQRFDVLAGPRCADGYVWWRVQYRESQGWTAEGDPQTGDYWLEPLSAPVDPALDDLAFCAAPPEDYTIVDFGDARLNQRTISMLDHATEIYHARGGLLAFDFREAIVQGSYNPGAVAASFGTHDAGGAVDLSVRERGTYRILQDEILLMLRALRIAGFAAWLRAPGELYPDSPIHIHAIAIGDAQLSPAARDQLDGPFGYFRGHNGLPQEDGIPLPDSSGEMVLCPWMRALGFSDLRAS